MKTPKRAKLKERHALAANPEAPKPESGPLLLQGRRELRQKLAEHASEQQNLHYTHPEIAALRAAIDKLPRLDTKP